MNPQLDWQVTNDDGDWESIAQAKATWTLRLPGWIWPVATAMLLLWVAGKAIVIRGNFQRAIRQIAFQIQCVADLEARALAQSDFERYLAQQDASLPGWYAWQTARIGQVCRKPDADMSGPDTLASSAQVSECSLAAPAKVASVEIRGDVAWVEVITDEGSLRRVRFYRRTDQGWLHTAPQIEFWGEPVELKYGKVLVRAHERDLPYVEPAVAHIVTVVHDICAILDCPQQVSLEVRYSHKDTLPRLSGHVLTLASPWLTGIPVDDAWDKAYLDELTDLAGCELMSQVVHLDGGWLPDPAFPPDVAHEGLLHECTLSRNGELGQSPILSSIGHSKPGAWPYIPPGP